MILAKEQIYRYMRHILIPEISGQGQKKILDSSVFLYSENVEAVTLALYYSAASGIGKINCRFNYLSGWNALLNKLTDLNNDSVVQLLDDEAAEKKEAELSTRIITGSPHYVRQALSDLARAFKTRKFVPTIISMHNDWKGAVKTLCSQSELERLIADLETDEAFNACSDTVDATLFPNQFSASFSSLMAVLEHLKLVLNIGKPISEALYYDLSAMSFEFTADSPKMLNKLLTPAETINKYSSLNKAKVLVAGCGGLGSPAAYLLAASGIGEIGLIDFDTVEISNLNRQIMHTSSRIGMPKVQSGKLFLEGINPEVKVQIHDVKLSRSNVSELIAPYDIVICGFDNLSSRYILNDACYSAGKPLIEAGALDISGLATTIIPKDGHCYRCIFPETEDNSRVPSCSETGVLGPVPGIMGIIQSVEAVKLLCKIGEPLKNKIFLFDVFDTDIYVAAHGKNRYCELCG